LEIRADDEHSLLNPLNDPETSDAVRAERAFQSTLGVGCAFPVGGHAIVEGDDLRFLAMIAPLDGMELVKLERRGSRRAPEELGRTTARDLLEAAH
jgi:hydroxymethylbilane synthase